jgi:ESX secretion system protein EccE
MAMNEAPPTARAVARVGANASPLNNASATFMTRRRPGYLGPVNVLQLVLLEAFVVLILVLLRHSRWMLLVGAVLTILVLVITFGRSRGRWWIERTIIRMHYRRRLSSGRLPADDLRLAALHRLVPDLYVETAEGSGGTQVGIGRDGAGSFAAVQIVPPAGVRGDPLAPLPMRNLARIVTESEQSGAVVQVVTHTVPAPTISVNTGRPVAESYQQLLSDHGGSLPADQITWVVVRFDARTVAEASVGGADQSQETPVILAALVRRVGKTLKRAGLDYQVLDADGLLDALTRSCDLEQPQTGHASVEAKENWESWHSNGLDHVCFWVSDWPDLRHSGALMDQMCRTPAALTSVALILAPRDNAVEVRCLTRVAADPSLLGPSCTMVRKMVESVGGKLFRLDGEQAPAVYASAPTGGGAR